jgi:hypothetical protein
MARHLPKLRRRPPSREPKATFFVYCEGKNTEPAYFEALKRRCGAAIIEIEIVAAVGVPLTMAEAAIEQAKRLRPRGGRRTPGESFAESDQVWVVFDRDEHPNIEEAVALCLRHRVGVARSNPCFEVWLILHQQDYDRPDGRHAVQKLLQRLRPEYDPHAGKRPNCHELLLQIEAAERRALQQLARREAEGDPYGAPSTTVGHLTQAIRMAAQSSSATTDRSSGGK